MTEAKAIILVDFVTKTEQLYAKLYIIHSLFFKGQLHKKKTNIASISIFLVLKRNKEKEKWLFPWDFKFCQPH